MHAKSSTAHARALNTLDELLTTKEAATFLHLHPTTLHSWRRKPVKQPRFHKVGGRYYYKISDLEQFINECAVDQAYEEDFV